MGTSRRKGVRMKLNTVSALSAAALALLALSASASAKQITPYKFDRFIDGAGSTAGTFTSGIKRVEVNQSNGRVYTLEDRGESILLSQFDENGAPQVWTGLEGGVTSFSAGSGYETDLAVDNTGHGGGLYVQGTMGNKSLRAFNYDGSTRIDSFGWTGNRCRVDVGPGGVVWQGDGQFAHLWDPDTTLETSDGRLVEQGPCNIFFDDEEYVYTSKEFCCQAGVYKYVKTDELEGFEDSWEGFGDHSKIRFSYVETPNATIDQSRGLIYAIEEGNRVQVYSTEGQPLTAFGLGEGTYNGLLEAKGVSVNEATGDVYVTSRRSGAQPAGKESPVSPRVDVFSPQTQITVPDATTGSTGHPSKTSAVLKGAINPDGIETTGCKFEWGTSTQYLGGVVPCDQGNVFSGSTDADVTNELKSLTTGTSYHYRVAAKNTNDTWSYGIDREFEASVAPQTTPVVVDRVNTDGARFSAEINPNGGTTEYYVEVGQEDCSANPCTKVTPEEPTLGSKLDQERVFVSTTGLKPDSDYHGRLVAQNGAGTVTIPFTFRTYPAPPEKDSCGNALVRQQTSAFLLLDCRAYELVSAANAGGYDVESDLLPGQTPFTAYPEADDRVLYGLHFGSIPGIAGSPTNHGLDPYVAERGPDGWTSHYVGVPADGMVDPDPFGSPLMAADSTLDTFAFGGPDICSPCFPDGSTNIPLRLPDGSLVKGMTGTLNPPANPVGEVRAPLSANGLHLVFGAEAPFEEEGNSGSVSIYDRDLETGDTQIVSRMPDGSVMTGDVAELAISDDGSRVLVGKLVETDSAGNQYFDLYLHVGTEQDTIPVVDTPGGVSFSGMTSDGSMVFFSTADPLAGDTDSSVDVFRADVSATTAVVTRLSAGSGAGNTDSCEPPGYPESWNAVVGDGACNAVAFAGGTGMAADTGDFYFLSPEQLDGSKGDPNQANLYVVSPGGSPEFVETIDSSLVKPGAPPDLHPLATSDFTGATHSTPEAVAVDQATEDVYVYETGTGKVARYTSAGAAHNFTAAQPYVEGNRITGLAIASNSQSQIAVDNAPGSPFANSIYLTNEPNVSVFSQSGELLGTITGSGNKDGSFGTVCGVAIDPSNGTLYIGDRGTQAIWQYTPKSGATAPITDSDYDVQALLVPGFSVCNVAADASGHIYGSGFSNGPIRAFEESSFAAPAGTSLGSQFNSASRSVTVDPDTGQVYVQEGNAVKVFNSSLEPVTTFGGGILSGSRGIALNDTTGHAYATGALKVIEFGHELAAYHPIDNPAVIHGVKDADLNRTSDFQVTPNGNFAVFTSSLSLTGFQNLGRYEIYRHDAANGEVACASCATTEAAPTTDTTLASHGLDLTNDGRVFFTSRESLVLADTNGKSDAYQWSGGRTVGLISTGRSLSDSGLLSVSRDGKNAFFFTRDTLVPKDENAGSVKIYTARSNGGYKQSIAPVPCAAADECRGAGTQQPPPPSINSITGPGDVKGAPAPRDCGALLRRAEESEALAKRLRRNSTRRRAQKAASKAKKLRQRARACERSNGGNG